MVIPPRLSRAASIGSFRARYSMDHVQLDRIRESFRFLAPRGAELVGAFADRIAAAAPQLRSLLPADARLHAQQLLAPCGLIIKNLHRLDAIEYLLHDIGAKHQRRGVLPQHYGVARDALLAALAAELKDRWSEELAADWSDALNTVISVFLRGAGRARSKAA